MIRAAAVLSKHPSAVLYDFTTKLHMRPADVTRNERSRLVVELIRDPTTRVATLAHGWAYTPSDRELALWDQIEVDRIRATPLNQRANLSPLQRPWFHVIKPPTIPSGTRSRLRKWVERQKLGG